VESPKVEESTVVEQVSEDIPVKPAEDTTTIVEERVKQVVESPTIETIEEKEKSEIVEQ
ncbi:unnamed protein product, partial [Didymodactylos carnosus]